MWSPICDYITLDPKEEVETKVGKEEEKSEDTKN